MEQQSNISGANIKIGGTDVISKQAPPRPRLPVGLQSQSQAASPNQEGNETSSTVAVSNGSPRGSGKNSTSKSKSTKNEVPVPPRTASKPLPPLPNDDPTMQHSMSAIANVTPPNVVVGATGGIETMQGAGAAKEKEKVRLFQLIEIYD